MGNYFASKYFKSLKIEKPSSLHFSICKVSENKNQTNFYSPAFFLKACFLILQYIFCATKMKKETPNKKKKKTSTAFFFITSAVVVSAAVYYTVKEGRRIKEENKLLAYEVW